MKRSFCPIFGLAIILILAPLSSASAEEKGKTLAAYIGPGEALDPPAPDLGNRSFEMMIFASESSEMLELNDFVSELGFAEWPTPAKLFEKIEENQKLTVRGPAEAKEIKRLATRYQEFYQTQRQRHTKGQRQTGDPGDRVLMVRKHASQMRLSADTVERGPSAIKKSYSPVDSH